MHIIRLLFYLLAGAMDSSFLTVIHITTAFYVVWRFVKFIVQFGLPNHPARFTSYIVLLSLLAYTLGLALTDFGVISPWIWVRWRVLPLVAGNLCLLFQVIMSIASFSLIQQKVVSRIPLMGALLCFAFFQDQASQFVTGFILSGALFFLISGNKARYQKRIFLKMVFFLGLWEIFRRTGNYGIFLIGESLIFFVLFYFFIFEESVAIQALVQETQDNFEGASA